MALTELVNALRQQAIKQRERGRAIKQHCIFSRFRNSRGSSRHIRSRENTHIHLTAIYISLKKLKNGVLAAGVPPETALEAVDSCVDADTIIKYYRGGTA